MTVLVTGVAGFIGSHLAKALLDQGRRVIGLDNMNDYYDPALKQARLERLRRRNAFSFHKMDIADHEALGGLCEAEPEIEVFANLAAQAGVRYSLENPYAYVNANVMGQVSVIEACRKLPNLKHLVYASSSSVYGANKKLPFAVEDPVDHPVSLYAATKRSGELIADCYTRLYGLPMTGLRFFTVYGPWGRPDMSAYIFTKAIFEGRPIKVFNAGDMRRDFTYIDDIITGVLAVLERPPAAEDDNPPHRVYNLGNHRSEDLIGGPDALHRGARAGLRARGDQGVRRDAEGRRQGDLRRHRGLAPRLRLRAENPDRRGPAPLRGVVPRVSRGLGDRRVLAGHTGSPHTRW
jgi:UDP-glucuronate 4-epimerase